MSPTQRERAFAQIKALRMLFPELAQVKDALMIVVDEAQNGPPQGKADGTIDQETWKKLRSVRVALRDLLVALSVVGGEK